MSEAPRSPREGGCLCGAQRYRIDWQAVLTVYCCHCRDCQRESSSAFAISLVLPAAAFTPLRGDPHRAPRRADSGREIHSYFCGGCGTHLFARIPDLPDLVVLKAGTLDDTRGLDPVAQFWTSRKQDWVTLPAGQLVDPRQPDGFDEVVARYREARARDAERRSAGDRNRRSPNPGS
ncbi:MAG: GFA family protein [Kiloniellaceae bacterium]